MNTSITNSGVREGIFILPCEFKIEGGKTEKGNKDGGKSKKGGDKSKTSSTKGMIAKTGSMTSKGKTPSTKTGSKTSSNTPSMTGKGKKDGGKSSTPSKGKKVIQSSTHCYNCGETTPDVNVFLKSNTRTSMCGNGCGKERSVYLSIPQ